MHIYNALKPHSPPHPLLSPSLLHQLSIRPSRTSLGFISFCFRDLLGLRVISMEIEMHLSNGAWDLPTEDTSPRPQYQ